MRLVGNILWILFGGLILAILWGFVGIICCCTIIAILIGIQCFKCASLVIWPFGRDVCYSNSSFNFLLNVIWILLFGWELAIASCVIGLVWCMTIIGIPFGIQCFKFARLALLPFGAQIRKIH